MISRHIGTALLLVSLHIVLVHKVDACWRHYKSVPKGRVKEELLMCDVRLLARVSCLNVCQPHLSHQGKTCMQAVLCAILVTD